MKKLVSLRLDEEVLKTLDERMKYFRYWKKHGVLCQIIENVLLCADPLDLSNIVRHNRHSSMNLSIKAYENLPVEEL